MKRHTTRLYNLIFPIWIFWMVPSLLWLLLLPANFLWDSLVLLAAAGWLRLQGKKELWKRSIVKVWLIGFAADFAGAALSLVVMLLLNTLWTATSLTLPFSGCYSARDTGCMPGGLADLAAQPQVLLWEGGYFRGNGRKAESIAGSFYSTLPDVAADV